MFEFSLLNFFFFILSIITSIWAYFTADIYLKKRKYRHIPGPASKGIYGFYFGNSNEMNQAYAEGKMMEDKLAEWTQIYGPVFKFQIGFEFSIYTTDKAAIKEIFITKNFQIPIKLFKSFIQPYRTRYLRSFSIYLLYLNFSYRWFGYGLSTEPNKERWYHRRTIYNQRFHRNILLSLTHQFNAKGDSIMEKLADSANGVKPVCLFSFMRRATLDIIAEVAFNMDLDCINNDSEDSFNSVISEAIEITMRHFSDPIAEINPMKLIDRTKFKKLISILRNKARETILNRLNNSDGNFNDLLDSIIEACKSDNGLDMELMIDDFLIFFIAGSDTAVNTICSCLYLIEKHPHIKKKVKEEIYDVIGYRKEITNEDILKLKYCASIIKETLRINPPFAFLIRSNETTFKICDLTIPENSNIWVSTYVSSRMDSNFKDPLEFNPERFMKDSDSIDTHVDRFAYYPFSLGPRSCIGQNFGQIEVTILLVKLLQRFEFKIDQSELYVDKPYRELVREAKYTFSTI